MSVLCCSIPEFLFALARRQAALDANRPLALLDETERVLAATSLARDSGIIPGLRVRQALARCPDLLLHRLDVLACQNEHDTLLSVLVQTGLPVEAQDWGTAYVDLHEVVHEREDAQAVCADLGQQVRHALGESLQPALGWDTGKFTARAASVRSRAGQMRLVSHHDETRFLEPLPLTLLPLPTPALRHLDWLGIRTLGRFARLPTAAVQQRFGAAGKLAQQWAQGHDNRPVRPTVHAKPEPIDVDITTPLTSRELALDATMRALRSHLRAMAAQLQGCRRLRAELRFLDGSMRTLQHVFVEPVCTAAVFRAALARELQRLSWPGELTALQLLLLDVVEQVPTQLALFPELTPGQTGRAPFDELVARLTPRYGPIFWRGQVADERHPVAERRLRWVGAQAEAGVT